MRYELHLRNMKIGDVTEQEADFPNLWGTITYSESLERPTCDEHKRLARFLKLNRDSIRLIDIEHEQDVSAELDAINRELEAFKDYIETGDWLLITENGIRLPILCPIFGHDCEIVWRWNPREIDDG